MFLQCHFILRHNMTPKIEQDMLFDSFMRLTPSYQAGLGKISVPMKVHIESIQ